MIPALFSQEVYGCVDRQYSVTRNEAQRTIGVLKGRPRNILRDIWPAIIFNVNIVMDEAQFIGWQHFWTYATKKGTKSFRIRLRLDMLEVYLSGAEVYEVMARGPWQADYTDGALWNVNINLESPAVALALATICDVVYGGPLRDLSLDSIYGGPLTGLSEDSIVPCPEVRP